MFQPLRRGAIALALAASIVAAFAAAARSDSASRPAESTVMASTSQEEDEVVLPSRVLNVIERTQNAVTRVEASIDDAQYTAGLRSLAALSVDIRRAHRAALVQLNAPPADPEAETTPGPDSVVAVLTLEQSSITRLAGMFDMLTNASVVTALDNAVATAGKKRNRLLNTVVGLDPEGAGAGYADGMADTVDGYADEIANLSEALNLDRLSASGRGALTRALTRTQTAANKVNAAFGGGE
jgi:hypothetical protein